MITFIAEDYLYVAKVTMPNLADQLTIEDLRVSKLKCYKVTSNDADGCVLVFAESLSKAKSLASSTDWFCDIDFIDLIATREPACDSEAEKFGERALDRCDAAEQELMRSLGWYQLDESMESCESCGLYEWSGINDSNIYSDGDCERCYLGTILKSLLIARF